MALATKCPQCGALFRVVADQLKLRGGLVRCGQCRAVFDAIGSLTYVDDGALAQSRTVSALTKPVTPPPAAPDDGAARHFGPATTLRISPVAPATLAGNVAPRIELPPRTAEEPAAVRRRAKAAARARHEHRPTPDGVTTPGAGVPTLIAVSPLGAPATSGRPGAEGIEVVELAPAPDAPDHEARDDSDETPTFLKPKRRSAPRGFSIVFGGGTALLVVLAALQLAALFRSELMIYWPQSRPLLNELCGVFGCTVALPGRADQLAVIGTELQAIPGTDALELTAVVRNRAGFRQALPAVEVTLTDTRNRTLARKVFTPADYLASSGEPSSRIQEGLGPGSDYTIRVFFEARGLAPAGFLVYPFYL
jgi:predicted Zn finger-like uncharacterized protein